MIWKWAAGAFNQGLLLGRDRRAWSGKQAYRGGIPHVEIKWAGFKRMILQQCSWFVFTPKEGFSRNDELHDVMYFKLRVASLALCIFSF